MNIPTETIELTGINSRFEITAPSGKPHGRKLVLHGVAGRRELPSWHRLIVTEPETLHFRLCGDGEKVEFELFSSNGKRLFRISTDPDAESVSGELPLEKSEYAFSVSSQAAESDDYLLMISAGRA